MNCKNLKIKTKNYKKYIYCDAMKKVITFDDCRGCKLKEYKEMTSSPKYSTFKEKNTTKLKKSSIKKKSSKLAKLERERTSLFTDDLEHCIICGKSPVNKHEIFFGTANRQKSMKYKLVIPLCIAEHHNQIECKGIHFDTELREEWYEKGRTKFEEVYPDLNFLEIFGRTYKK